MEHVVFYPAPDGSPAFRRVASLDEAVRLVEHLRNVEGVSEVSVHGLTSVPLSFRAYYRVEVPAEEAVVDEAPVVEAPAPVLEAVPPLEDDAPVAEAVEAVEPVAAEEPVEEPMVPEPVMAEAALTVAPASPNGKRSLGFFAH